MAYPYNLQAGIFFRRVILGTSSDEMQSRWLAVLVACSFLVIITMGIRQGFGLFLLPITEALGTGREVFSLSMALQNLIWGIASPIAGGFADKYGSAKVALVGTASYALGLIIMGA